MRAPAEAPAPAAQVSSSGPAVVASLADIVSLAVHKRDLPLQRALETQVRLVSLEDGRIEIALEPGAPHTIVTDLSRKLGEWTGRRWMVVVSKEAGAPPLRVQEAARQADLLRGVQSEPLVQAVLARFPGAEIVAVRPLAAAADEEPMPGAAEERDADEDA
jgi:DNA polymerase-3 subunit gamma/tau